MENRVVQAHGANIGASCATCFKPQSREELEKGIESGKIVKCTEQECKGFVKPNITFFGEQMPKKFIWGTDRIRNRKRAIVCFTEEEKNKPLFEDGGCDLMIIIGTALAVFPFNSTVFEAGKGTPTVLMNMENLEQNNFDFEDLY